MYGLTYLEFKLNHIAAGVAVVGGETCHLKNMLKAAMFGGFGYIVTCKMVSIQVLQLGLTSPSLTTQRLIREQHVFFFNDLIYKSQRLFVHIKPYKLFYRMMNLLQHD